MTESHIVGDRVKVAAAGEFQEALFAGDDVFPKAQRPSSVAVRLLEHLALAASAGALMHDRHLVIIGRHHLHGGAVSRDPAFALAQVEEHAEDALLGARSRIKVVREHLIQIGSTVIDNKLLALKVGQAENRRGIDDGFGRKEGGEILRGDQALQHGQSQREEAGIHGDNRQRIDAHIGLAGGKEEAGQFLFRQPIEGLAAQVVKFRDKTNRESEAYQKGNHRQ